MEKPDKSARVRLDTNTQSTGPVDHNAAKGIRDLASAFLEALEKKQKKSQTKGVGKSRR